MLDLVVLRRRTTLREGASNLPSFRAHRFLKCGQKAAKKAS